MIWRQGNGSFALPFRRYRGQMDIGAFRNRPRSMLNVNAFYGTQLVWPSSISEGDLKVLKNLDNLIQGVPAPLESFQLTLTKTVQLPPPVIRDSVKSRSFRFYHSPQDAVTLFGTSVKPAPLQLRLLTVLFATEDTGRIFPAQCTDRKQYRAPGLVSGWRDH